MPNTGKPAPLETGPGEQKDDNIDDLGRNQAAQSRSSPERRSHQNQSRRAPTRAAKSSPRAGEKDTSAALA